MMPMIHLVDLMKTTLILELDHDSCELMSCLKMLLGIAIGCGMQLLLLEQIT
jgi:hypothetical protein